MAKPPHLVEVAVALPVFGTYTYTVPSELAPLVAIGKRVLVPFARRRVTGYVVATPAQSNWPDLKAVNQILDDQALVPPFMLPFLQWVSQYYIHPLGDVIKCALPGGLNIADALTLEITTAGRKALATADSAAIPENVRTLLGQMADGPNRLAAWMRDREKPVTRSRIQDLLQRGFVSQKRQLVTARTKPKLQRRVKATPDLPDRASVPDNAPAITQARAKVLGIIRDQGDISTRRLKSLAPGAPRCLKPLAAAGYIEIYDKQVYRDPFGEAIAADKKHVLTQEQQVAVDKVRTAMARGFSTHLLAGVTGSGKTEVYLQLVAQVLAAGRTALVLVPEIALMSQMEHRFRARLGDCIAVLHSGLTAGERLDQWLRILNGRATVAIGARSAIFAPLERLGLIIVDEEHDGSYKQESGLRYNARDLAVMRAKLASCTALLGSATPSVQSYHNVQCSKFSEITLNNRVEKRPLPEITAIDLTRLRDARGIDRFFSPELKAAMRTTLDRNEQILLFLNRRGFANYPVCGNCGATLQCKNCAITLTLHKSSNAYRCHYCGFNRAAKTGCDVCGSSTIFNLGLGTEKVESALKAIFPEAEIARLDRDTTTRKGSLLRVLKDLRDGKTDILVGTQMVAKGHDFPNITLVGILCADLSLNFPDFRASERTFQLLAQVSGRAGRGKRPGRVILQTYNPDHFSIAAARNQDFQSFYAQEIEFRRALNYPPFSRLVQLKIAGPRRRQTREVAEKIGHCSHDLKAGDPGRFAGIEVLGPIEAPLAKIANRYRWQILLKGSTIRTLHRYVRRLVFGNDPLFSHSQVKVAVDVDPFLMM